MSGRCVSCKKAIWSYQLTEDLSPLYWTMEALDIITTREPVIIVALGGNKRTHHFSFAVAH